MCSVARNYKSQRRYLEILEENSWPKCELTFWGKLFFNVMLPTGRVLAPIVIIQHVAQQNFIKNCHKMTSYKWIFSPQTLVALKIVVKDGLSLKLEPFSCHFLIRLQVQKFLLYSFLHSYSHYYKFDQCKQWPPRVFSIHISILIVVCNTAVIVKPI